MVFFIQNYHNLRSWIDEDSQIGGLVFGRPSRKEVVLVTFAPSESLDYKLTRYMLSCMSAGIYLVSY
ncbi:unnamed protein product [Nippostrongylus brasiliensis]|uniref:Rad51 domain-containing protein n=1 Tax=Nippostrongylus brasiliensis TaxID=27835 RepID=A0A0N4XCI1_NIPBR|nr:unnamed protein product [Nippostrongylus brasiliensis]